MCASIRCWNGVRNPGRWAAIAAALWGIVAGAGAASAGEVFLRASQLGYRPRDSKSAVAFSREAFNDAFRVVEAESGRTVFEGKAAAAVGPAWGKAAKTVVLDFSEFRRPGRYKIAVGESRSIPFEIGDNVFRPLPDMLLDCMRQQRCGYNPWLDAKCHQHDGRTAYGPLPAGTPMDAAGGWHDAGDLLKYLLTSSNATAQMLLAWQLGSPTKGMFGDQVDALGKPGANGLDDLLDEARWGLDWMLKLHPAPDQLYHQVADDRDHRGWRLPPNDKVDYGWGEGGARVVYFADGRPQGLRNYKSESTGVANLAGRYAAAMALAYQIWKDDPKHGEFAKRCLKAGREVYRLGRAQEGVQQGNSCVSPYRYEETTWADDMEWGAAELYRATREQAFLDDAIRYARRAGTESWMGRPTARHYQYYPFMNLGHFRLYDLVDNAMKAVLAGYYREGIEACVAKGRDNPYQAGVPFIWCSNNLMVALVTQCDCYERMTGDGRYRAFAAQQRDWLLGRNPWGYTMFTRIGTQYPTDVHLITTQLTKRSVVGGLVDGPVSESIFKNLRGVHIRMPDPLEEFQDARAVYHNDVGDYSTNEPTMDGTAAAILMWVMPPR